VSVPVFPVLPGGRRALGRPVDRTDRGRDRAARVWLRKVRAIHFALDHAVGSGSGTGVRAG